MGLKYKEIIFTNHALERLKKRNLKPSDAYAVLKRPQFSRKADAKSKMIYYRDYGSQRIEVVTAKNERKEVIVVSVWSKPIEVKPSLTKRFLTHLYNKLFHKK